MLKMKKKMLAVNLDVDKSVVTLLLWVTSTYVDKILPLRRYDFMSKSKMSKEKMSENSFDASWQPPSGVRCPPQMLGDSQVV
jgi:hypothetical protein